ncbi:GNAT family N-acetyltransferase [Sutcliffiella halmapala]|uniref:GNAT family N-acetyltransferase n=1 Tax=Sutcliffiella halmapala TaxID=79882 RepID=UPI000995007B|nr:GNAT family N-acetyltransferase [Sutcliffiella halmapala]
MDITQTYRVNQATASDSSAVLKILKNRALWLKENGSEQWIFLLSGQEDAEIVAKVEAGLFYKVLSQDSDEIIAVFLLSSKQDRWDIELWGEDDGTVGSAPFYLHKLAVSLTHKGERVGDFVMEWIKNHVRSLDNAECMRLDCVASSDKLIHFYKEHGFVLQKIVMDHCLFEWRVHTSSNG